MTVPRLSVPWLSAPWWFLPSDPDPAFRYDAIASTFPPQPTMPKRSHPRPTIQPACWPLLFRFLLPASGEVLRFCSLAAYPLFPWPEVGQLDRQILRFEQWLFLPQRLREHAVELPANTEKKTITPVYDCSGSWYNSNGEPGGDYTGKLYYYQSRQWYLKGQYNNSSSPDSWYAWNFSQADDSS